MGLSRHPNNAYDISNGVNLCRRRRAPSDAAQHTDGLVLRRSSPK